MIVFVAEHPGAEEEIAGVPLVGNDGRLLQRMLARAGLLRTDEPPENWKPSFAKLGLRKFLWARSDHAFLNVLDRPLREGVTPTERAEEIEARRGWLHVQLGLMKPTIVIALGNIALEAFAGTAYKIGDARGVCMRAAKIMPGLKVMPTYNPSFVRKEFRLFDTVVADFRRAAEEAKSPLSIVPDVELWIEPSLSDMNEWWLRYGRPSTEIAVDIETHKFPIITCIGFAADEEHAICVPFVDWRKPGGSYWDLRGDEDEAWGQVRDWLASPIAKTFHNGPYDVSWLWGVYGLAIRNWKHDTMLMHHVLYPELPKGLEFLGAAYGFPPMPWKTWRVGAEKRGA